MVGSLPKVYVIGIGMTKVRKKYISRVFKFLFTGSTEF